MIAFLSMPYVYPYAHIVGPALIAFLAIGVALFKRLPNARRYVLTALFFGGLLESFNGVYPDGVIIGLLTLTCVGILAVFHFIKASAVRLAAGLPFLALGVFLVFQAFEFGRMLP